jgi:hypothetical protein
MRKPFLERFMSRVDASDPFGCWLWTAARSTTGYGACTDPAKPRGKRWRHAHRAIYEYTNGPVPDGLVVRHLCHHKLCVNPLHLALGTHADNARDKVEAGRSHRPQGEKCGMAKLSEVAVQEIRLLADDYTLTALGKMYGVDVCTIFCVVRRKTWRHVPGVEAFMAEAPHSERRAGKVFTGRRAQS